MMSLDTVFDLLRSERRRHVLYYLDEREGQVSVEEVTEEIAREETDDGEIPPEKYEQIELSLHHTHLPKSAVAEFIEYDAEAGEVYVHGSPDEEFDTVLTVAEVLDEHTGDE
ncbi:MAG: hypothetical protein IH933_10855 [Euryarchaeota archaeon]|nr:hypothetical protein [Euryarchaeota archaeon]